MRNRAEIDLKDLKAEYRNLHRSWTYWTRRCEILEKVLEMEADGLRIPGGPTAQEKFFEQYMAHFDDSRGTEEAPMEFVDVLLQESQKNRTVHPSGRRWSHAVVLFCFLIRCLGAKAYEHCRTVLTLPCKTTLLDRFAVPVRAWRQSLLNVDKIGSICKLFRRTHDLGDLVEVEAVLGVDAMAIEPVSTPNVEAPAGANNVFLFYLMPLRCELKCLPVHVMPRTKGNAGPDVIAMVKAVKERLQEEGIVVRYVATDGDSGYKCLHDSMFAKWAPVYASRGLDGVSDAITTCDCPIAGDLLHILKNARARLLGSRITLSLDGSFCFTAGDLNRILQLGSALTDRSSKGKMRDRYALELFSLDNFTKLVAQKEWMMAFFLLPYALWTAAVRYPKLSTQMRREMLNVVFDMFVYHMGNIDSLDREAVSQNRTDNKAQYFCSRTHCVRVLNTLAVKLTELTRSPDNLALGRIGTHGVECQFGTVRLLCHNKHSWKMVMQAFSKLTIIKDTLPASQMRM